MRENKVAIVPVLSGITLADTENNTQADADRILVDTYFSQILNLSCTYTTGTGETTNTCEIKVYGHDGTNWIALGETTVSSGDATFAETTFKIAGAAAETEYTAAFRQNITFNKIKVTALESGVASNYGTLTAVAMVQ